jgi:hypothetical protein
MTESRGFRHWRTHTATLFFLPLIPASGLFAGSRSSQRALRRLQRVLVCSAAFLIEIKQHLFRLI